MVIALLPPRDERTGRFVRWYPKIYLEPCMFCGTKTTVETTYAKLPWSGSGTEALAGIYWVQCPACGARGPELDKENAVSEWNEIASQHTIPKRRRKA